jgi:hypothetical protein
MINKIEIDNNIIYHTKVNLFTQIKLYVFDKLPLYAIPKRQNKIIIVDPNCDLTEIDIKC